MRPRKKVARPGTLAEKVVAVGPGRGSAGLRGALAVSAHLGQHSSCVRTRGWWLWAVN